MSLFRFCLVLFLSLHIIAAGTCRAEEHSAAKEGAAHTAETKSGGAHASGGDAAHVSGTKASAKGAGAAKTASSKKGESAKSASSHGDSPAKDRKAARNSDRDTSDSQDAVTFDPRMLIPPGHDPDLVVTFENIEDYLQDRSNKLGMVLVVECVDARAVKQVSDSEGEIRPALAKVINRHTALSVSTWEGKLLLRDDLARAINQAAGGQYARQIYFKMFNIKAVSGQ